MAVFPRRSFLVAALLAALLSSSCSGRIGWGVVLWGGAEVSAADVQAALPSSTGDLTADDSGDEALPPLPAIEDLPPQTETVAKEPRLKAGQLVPVYLKSEIQKVYAVGIPGARAKADISQWRVEYFGSKGKASDFLKRFKPYESSYALALRDGLPVRVLPDGGANRVYRLRSGELVKILGKAQGKPVMTGGKPLPGDWYQILTQDGTRGYCFSNTLAIFDAASKTPTQALEEATAKGLDPGLEAALAKTWRPDSFRLMIASGHFDLDAFQSRYGLFPDPAAKRIRIELPGLSRDYAYGEPVKLKANLFGFSGTPLQLQIREDGSLMAQFPDDAGRSLNQFFSLIDKDIDAIARDEESRRQAVFESILAFGPACASPDRGTISLAASRRFAWTGYGSWSPLPIDPAAGATGTVDLDVYLDPSLADQWAGVLSFRFDGAPAKPARFFYAASASGLKLEPLPLDGLDSSGLVAVRRAPRPQQSLFAWRSE